MKTYSSRKSIVAVAICMVMVAVWLPAIALGQVDDADNQQQQDTDTDSGGVTTFPDVPLDAFYATPVAELHAQGVFTGTLCGSAFCPGEAIDRKTMAVWIVRILDGMNPQPVSQSRFDDVDANSFHAPYIERLADLGVTTGCSDGTIFCPDDPVTRAQMAVFLSRAYSLPQGRDPGFSDVPRNAWYADQVASLAASGITLGCGNGMYCPSQATSRAQMATFLHRAET